MIILKIVQLTILTYLYRATKLSPRWFPTGCL